jgi:lipopolysaccharide transport system permease protein
MLSDYCMKKQMHKKIARYEPDNSIKKGYLSLINEIIDEIYNNKWLIYQFFKRDFIAGYKQTFLGVFWALLLPLIAVSAFIFLNRSGILVTGNISLPYPVYAVFSISYWLLFSTTTTSSANTLVSAGPMIVKINFSKKSLILASAGQAILVFAIQFLLLLCLFCYYKIHPSYYILFTPFFMLPLLLLALGLGFFLSVLNGISREVGTIIPSFLMFFLFVTPILYQKPMQGISLIFATYNPIYYLITVPREIVLGSGLVIEWTGYAYSYLLSILFFVFCLITFHLIEPRIAERI